MMAGNIWRYDQYGLRKYSTHSIDYFLDIGGCVGTTSLLFKSIDPFARVIAIEPSKDDYGVLNRVAGFWGVECHNFAFGDGRQLCFDNRKQGSHRFYTEDEKQWWPESPEYLVESKTLPELFEQFKIKGRYIIKLDCEGGERFLLDNPEAIEIIKGSVQFNMEYHRGFGGEPERWRQWFMNFTEHSIKKRVGDDPAGHSMWELSNGPVDAPDTRWRSEYMLEQL